MDIKYNFRNNNNLQKFNDINLRNKNLIFNETNSVDNYVNMLLNENIDINSIVSLLMEQFFKKSMQLSKSINKRNILQKRIHYIILRIRENYEKNSNVDNVEIRMNKLYLLLFNNLVVNNNRNNSVYNGA